MLTRALKELLDDLFQDIDGDWALMGGHAANLYRREIRTTVDVDIVVPRVTVGTDEPLSSTARRLAAEGWTVMAMPPGGWLLRVSHSEHGALDLVVAETEYQDVALARAAKSVVGEVRVKTLAVEDVVIHKLIANRAKDDADVIDILKTGLDLDRGYLDHWLGEWDVAERFERLAALASAELCGDPAPD